MRFVKLGKEEFQTLDDVRRVFRQDLPARDPPGKFRVKPRHSHDKLAVGEPLVFTYQARVVFTARAGSTLLPNEDDEREKHPGYFVVNLATLREADEDLHDVERQYNEAAGTDVGLVGQNWNRLRDSVHAEELWARLRGARDYPLPEEVVDSTGLVEGAVRAITVNAYERNPVARSRCIDHYGATCVVCGFSFGAVYGQLAEGFIHVHHVKPLSEIGGEYKVDPVADLRPVCANCHAIIHLGGGCRKIEEARRLVDPRVLAFWASFAEQVAAADRPRE